jgi:hypothetical protein
MRWTGRLRAFAAFGLTGALLLLLITPLCAAEVCPMDATARRMGCKPLASDCCQTHGERTAPSPHQVMPLAPFSSPLGSIVAMAEPLLAEPSWEELEPPAILQGIGLHTLLSVFLI